MADPAAIDDQLVQLAFALARGHGAFAMLLGSGLSRAAGIPTGWEITLDLVLRYAQISGAERSDGDWHAWFLEKTGNAPTYSGVVEKLATTAVERRALLEGYIEPTEEDRSQGRKLPTRAHHAIADLVARGLVKVLVTTNFDRLLENALRDRGVEPTIVSTPDMLAGAEPLTHSECYLIKLHGDYKDARLLNTEEELSVYPAPYDALLDRIFDEYGLIAAGWSGEWDHALRAALQRAPTRRYPVYWAHRGGLVAGASELVKARRAIPVVIEDADSFFVDLGSKARSALDVGRSPPDSLELLLVTTKRLLSRKETAIDLEDLLAGETSRLLANCAAPDLSPAAAWNEEEFVRRVSRYEAASERLAKLAGLLGRWGGVERLPQTLSVIRSLWVDAESVGSGLTIYLGLRSYPAVLVFSAYALGLVRAGEWGVLCQLLNAKLGREHRDPVHVVPALFAGGWKGGDNSSWQKLPGLDRHHTAFCDHLFAVFKVWLTDFVSLEPETEMLFERWELLCSLAHFSREDEAQIAEALEKNPHHHTVWIPFGRSSWDTRHSARLLEEMQAEPFRGELLSGGFANRSSTMLELFVRNFGLLSSRFRW